MEDRGLRLDYAYRSGAFRWDIEQGMWGIFRIYDRRNRELDPINGNNSDRKCDCYDGCDACDNGDDYDGCDYCTQYGDSDNYNEYQSFDIQSLKQMDEEGYDRPRFYKRIVNKVKSFFSTRS